MNEYGDTKWTQYESKNVVFDFYTCDGQKSNTTTDISNIRTISTNNCKNI